ncbi:hypothetical protein ACP4OV_007710 [Aristida adscensionis]
MAMASSNVADVGVVQRVAVQSACKKKLVVGNTDEYVELCSIGEGSFGAVIKARHRSTGQTVAIKLLTEHGGGGPEELLQEAQVLRDCDGVPFVVGFHGLIRAPTTGDLCLVMECLGPTLQDVLHEQRRRRRRRRRPLLPEATVRSVMWQLLSGAKKIHERRIVHRDIKTKNILVGGDHTLVKICDFGLAMSMVSEKPPYKPAGTLRYMAPEVLLEMPDYDAAVDTWSLGCVMAELIAGEVPFQGESEELQLCEIFSVLGVPDAKTWPWFWSTDFAADVLSGTDGVLKPNGLHERFTEKMLSKEGFQVLNGLLTCNPGERLTAATALQQPWFAKVDKLVLPRKEKAPSALPKESLIVSSPKKRRKLQCV